ncbi:hypothetical protein H0H92_000705 [Tricholoma furcatifolium]|nr:hypothetical protein H0H92_000705 [Tricholoma furcatifolium]
MKMPFRYALDYKGLTYETVWIEYPDIAPLCKEKGISPTVITPNGPHYTLPAIYDPNTSTSLAESAAIAEYLDKAYPNTPKLFPSGSHALQYAFIEALSDKLKSLWAFSLPASHAILNPISQEYFRTTREKSFGKTLEDVIPKGDEAKVEWAKVKAAFDAVNDWLEKGKSNGPYFLGKEPAFVDFVLAAYLLYLKKIWGGNSGQWRDISSWNDGRWAKLLDDFAKYESAQ